MTDRSVPTDEALAEAGLYDADGEDAAQRRELLHFLSGLGATIEDLVDWRDELPVLASVLPLRTGPERLTIEEVAERVGAPVDEMIALWRAVGLPQPEPGMPVFSEQEAELVGALSHGEALFGRDAVLQLARVLGSGMARIADAMVSAFMVNIAPRAEADGPLALAQANAQAAELMPLASQWMDALLRRHLEVARRPLLPPVGVPHPYETQVLAIGFADIAGSSALAQQLSISDFGASIGAFESAAMDKALEHSGRLVKFIGDEAMFAVAEPAAACEVGLQLVDFVDAHPILPSVRVGIALGEVLNREGDYYGPVVNMAARIVKVAEPGVVIVSDELHAAMHRRSDGRDGGPRYSFEDLDRQQLRGFEEPVRLFALRRP